MRTARGAPAFVCAAERTVVAAPCFSMAVRRESVLLAPSLSFSLYVSVVCVCGSTHSALSRSSKHRGERSSLLLAYVCIPASDYI